MSTAVETLKTVLAELTVEERSELARFLVDSIDLEGSTDVEDAWDSELARAGRRDTWRESQWQPAALVFSQLREKHQ